MQNSLNLKLDPHSAEPLYRQLVQQIRRLCAAGTLRPGTEMPSVRELAVQFAINPMTISKAYSALEAEGLLNRPRGAKMLVAEQRRPKQSKTERQLLLLPALQSLMRQAQELGLSADDLIQAIQKLEPPQL
jgi:GntR family transcriptional regulator